SAIVWAITVGWSSDQLMTYIPLPLIRPKVGFIAATPQKDGGRRAEPPGDFPIASGSIRAPTAAEEPELEPPGVWARFHGLQEGGLPLRSGMKVVPGRSGQDRA